MKISLAMTLGIYWTSLALMAQDNNPASTPPQTRNPWADYRFAPDALQEIDLASDTDWSLSIDGGAPRPIKVTAGGWNSDQQSPQIPSDRAKGYVTYERMITIPAEAQGRVVKILFGACNYGAEVFLDRQKVAEHKGPETSFEADLTKVATPGKAQQLQIKAYTCDHFGGPPVVPRPFDFNTQRYKGMTNFPYGLTGYVRLTVYPTVYISDLFVKPSVSAGTLSYDVWINNGDTQAHTVTLKGTLSAWGGKTWSYPALPDRNVTIKPDTTEEVSVDAVPWTLGTASYWWPNIPYQKDYQAVLHYLNLSVEEGNQTVHQRSQRFGFVEYREGPYFYMVNGVRFTSFGDSNSDGQVGEYDCWTETPCFQPPHGPFKGCPETWRRYQEIGFNDMRLSTSVPTPYMMETADEAGYMLMPEGGSWGNGTSVFTKDNFSSQLQETIRACRNHPCVARYSLANESLPRDFASPNDSWRWLIDAALEVDPTRPYVFEVNNNQTGPVPGMEGGHAYQMEHYDPVVPGGDHIRGMGECAWTTDGMGPFVGMALAMRVNDWALFAPWSWVNFWPNFLEGMNAKRVPWKLNDFGDRTDGVDGWGSPMVKTVQWALDPYLVIDRDLLATNPQIRENSKGGPVGWPYKLPSYQEGMEIKRHIEMFNDALAGKSLELRWAAHWDNAEGPVVGNGTVAAIEIEPGFHAPQTVTLEAPKLEASDSRTLCLVLEVIKDGQIVNQDDHTRLTVIKQKVPPGN